MLITLIFIMQFLAVMLAWVGRRERAIVIWSVTMVVALLVFIDNIDTVTSIVL